MTEVARLGFLVCLIMIGVSPVVAQTYPLRQGNSAQGNQQQYAPGVAPVPPTIALPATPRHTWVNPPVAEDVMTLGTPKPGPVDLTAQKSSRDGQAVQPNSSAVVTPDNGEAPVGTIPVGTKLSGIARVIDGNTLLVGGQVVVLNGADAPEATQTCTNQTGLGWRCGEQASRHLQSLIGDVRIVCTVVSNLSGAVAAMCHSGNTDFAQSMIRDGFALVPPGMAPLYVWDQSDARSSRRGIWNGSFRFPWTYRTSPHS